LLDDEEEEDDESWSPLLRAVAAASAALEPNSSNSAVCALACMPSGANTSELQRACESREMREQKE
jgi:hypothetical protein